MYAIYFTINCAEQLTFSKTFVHQLQFEQSLICCLKVKLLKNNFYYRYGRWFLIFNQFSLFCQLLDCVEQLALLCRPVFLSYQILSSWTSPAAFNINCFYKIIPKKWNLHFLTTNSLPGHKENKCLTIG